MCGKYNTEVVCVQDTTRGRGLAAQRNVNHKDDSDKGLQQTNVICNYTAVGAQCREGGVGILKRVKSPRRIMRNSCVRLPNHDVYGGPNVRRSTTTPALPNRVMVYTSWLRRQRQRKILMQSSGACGADSSRPGEEGAARALIAYLFPGQKAVSTLFISRWR